MKHITNPNEKKVICTYDDYIIFEENGKTYYQGEEDNAAQEVVLVKSVFVGLDTRIAESELIDPGFNFDVSGELDEETTYCYWSLTK